VNLTTHHDKILNTVNSIISNERDRALEAGEDRERIGALIELCGLNKKSVAFAKALHKMEPAKREDVLRSFDALRVEFEKNWGGQKTVDMFENSVEPADDLPGPSYQADDDFPDEPGDPELAADADDFDKHLADAAE
jgi:hypothetical protein